MFRGLTASFANMKVGRKLGYGFGAVVFLTVLVGTAAFVTRNIQTTALESLLGERDQSATNHLIVEEVALAEEEALSFETVWQSMGYQAAYDDFIVLSQQHTDNALKAIAASKVQSADEPTELAKLDTVNSAVEAYKQGVLNLADLYKTHGFETTGLDGQLTKTSQDIEVVLRANNSSTVGETETTQIDPLLLDYLDMKVNEHQYQAHLTDQYVQATHDKNAALQNDIAGNKSLSEEQKAALTQSAKDYIAAFDQLVEVNKKIVTQTAALRDGADSIEPILIELEQNQEAQQQEALTAYQTAQTTGDTAQAVFAVTAVVAGILLAVGIGRGLSSQVAEIDKLFRAAAIGNFSARAKVLSHDELGQTAEGVNAMLERLTDYMGIAAKVAQQRFSDVVTTMADWVWETDLAGNFTYSSDQIFEMTGRTQDEVIGHAMVDLVAAEDRDSIARVIENAQSHKAAFGNLEVRANRQDGSSMILLLNGVPVIDENGRYTGIRGTGSDVTATKEAERQLRENEATLRGVFDNMQDAFYRTDRQGHIIWASPSAARMMGYDSVDEVHGLDTATSFWAHPDQRDQMLALLRENGKVTDYEVEVRRKDGSSFAVSTSSSFYHDASGDIAGVEGAFHDITERKHAEAQIEQRNAELAATLGELRNLIADVENAAGQVTGASDSLQGVIQSIANDASSSANVAEEATGSADAGERAVADTISAMGRIRETTQETARRIKKLGEVSQEIGEVVRLIDEIADRVTVLALNASIQAAAAGEAGRGFAVVAEEVQRLAERATGATRQIENLIKGVQGEINEAMVSVEEVTQEVVGGSQLAQNAGERMVELNHTVNDLANLIQTIAQSTTRQTADSLVTLATLAENLQSSVAALRTPEGEAANGNGHGNGMQRIAQ